MNAVLQRAALLTVVISMSAACGGSDEPDEGAAGQPVASSTAAPPTPTTSSSSLTRPTAPPSTAAPTTIPAPTTAPATDSTAATVTAPPTTEPSCSGSCPPTDEERALIDGFVEAYNDGDWEAWTALLVDDEPTWQTPIGLQNAALARFDFEWSAGLNDVWTLGDCLQRSFDISCEVTIEDDVHRALAYRDLKPSECRFAVSITDEGLIDTVSYDVVPCHEGYDSVFHVLGGWFQEQYPDEETVHAAHYRAWNQPRPDRAERVIEVLPEFVAYLDAVGESLGGDDHDT